MLGKTAGGLYWMFRYLERSENTTRLIEVGQRMALTRPDKAQDEWASIIDTAGVREGYDRIYPEATAGRVVDFLLRDKDNPSSVMSSIDAARLNARLVRTALTREVWEATNECWMLLRETLAEPITARELPDTLALIRKQSALVRGALHGTMLRNETYNFARIGTFTERADNTARILDVKYYVLLPTANKVGSSLDNVQWETILRSVSGHRSYRISKGTDISPSRVAEFLILDRQMPRSLIFCCREIAENMKYLHRNPANQNNPHDALDRVIAEMEGETITAIFEAGLHEYLTNFKSRILALGSDIERTYRFYG
jgi:uncharacterized alpha-E superfamily protein